MKSKIKKVIDYLEEKSYFLAVPLFLWTVLATALGKHKLDWIDAFFLIGYTFLARSKR
jgi:hypothetical protein